MVIGLCPCLNDDVIGHPFSDGYGKWMRKAIRAAGYERGQVYLTHAVKCYPSEAGKDGHNVGRQPTDEEILLCQPFLFEQIKTIKPKMIITLGENAFNVFRKLGIQEKRKIASYRGDRYKFGIGDFETHVVPTLHPQLVVHASSKLRKVEFVKDFKRTHEFLFSGKDWIPS
jgi:DNA polymerase